MLPKNVGRPTSTIRKILLWIFVIGFWFLSNLTAGLGTLGIEETGGTAWFAHLGGFVSGVVLNQIFKQIRIE